MSYVEYGNLLTETFAHLKMLSHDVILVILSLLFLDTTVTDTMAIILASFTQICRVARTYVFIRRGPSSVQAHCLLS